MEPSHQKLGAHRSCRLEPRKDRKRHAKNTSSGINDATTILTCTALTGGSNFATTLSLNACPYLATCSSVRFAPDHSISIEATTILTCTGSDYLIKFKYELNVFKSSKLIICFPFDFNFSKLIKKSFTSLYL